MGSKPIDQPNRNRVSRYPTSPWSQTPPIKFHPRGSFDRPAGTWSKLGTELLFHDSALRDRSPTYIAPEAAKYTSSERRGQRRRGARSRASSARLPSRVYIPSTCTEGLSRLRAEFNPTRISGRGRRELWIVFMARLRSRAGRTADWPFAKPLLRARFQAVALCLWDSLVCDWKKRARIRPSSWGETEWNPSDWED